MLLPSVITHIADKFEAVLAVDMAIALLKTFASSSQMCTANLLSLYLSEELIEALPEVLLSCLFSLLLTHERPYSEPPIFYAVLLSSMINSSRDQESLKKLKTLAEEKFSKCVFANYNTFTTLQQQRVVDFLGVYLSQSAGRDLGLSEPFLLKLTESALTEGQKQALKKAFAVVCNFIYVKKAKEQLDS